MITLHRIQKQHSPYEKSIHLIDFMLGEAFSRSNSNGPQKISPIRPLQGVGLVRKYVITTASRKPQA